ncbi:hypothetical protein [Pseudomonas protegens]|uniref:Uncharacterized protein n=1 Tax=Pseudomonas protegens (strain DSM 19095 / LMG 27888 / CFBP 6595 / CHA0) TaxID=1124983 RepID=A0A2C9ET99_PSEPH|nr:hypothetical protein [Pseudomonas protegens]AGL86896.1 hypothetical protein PFLCHA0_c51490 [Pseudomonas protegens CHA0]MBP5108909.1 hypothetical protein [Pseudomonas protegens]QTU27671.1 hypothetical protein HUT21_25835 [Pseudomonas protegens]QTU31307.1 hypothetical protein HUT20_12465 [Pseudomonas protegens]VAV71413.1 hypothetical protein PPRCHA0_5111 [Pseudomonas protegens CHA0]
MSVSVEQVFDSVAKRLVFSAFFDIVVKENQKSELICIVANLHAENLIDVLAEYQSLEQDIFGFEWFTIIEVFAGVLELIDAPVADIMFSINRLGRAGGADFHLLSSFEKYCLANPASLEEAFELAKNLYPESNFLNVVLIAGSKIDFDEFQLKAINLIDASEPRLRALALQSLSRFGYEEDVIRAKLTLDAIDKGLIDCDEDFLSAALETIFSLAPMSQDVESKCLILVGRIFKCPSDLVICTAAKLFMMGKLHTPESIVSILLEEFKTISPTNREAIKFLDLGFEPFLIGGKARDILVLIEHLLEKNGADLAVSDFEHFMWSLDEPQSTILRQQIVTRWLLSSKRKLCSSVGQIVSDGRGSNIGLSADLGLLDEIPPNANLLLAMRACGWLFAYPVSAASLMVSSLNTASDAERAKIEEMLFNPLLISYGGSVGEYFRSKRDELSQESAIIIDRVLCRLNSYHEGLQSISNVKELEAPLSQRQAYQRRFNRQMEESFKSAKKDSLMTALMGRPSVILYGNSSINYVYHGPNGEKVRQENPMHSFSTSVEYPSLGNLDSGGLEYMLRAFRVGAVRL